MCFKRFFSLVIVTSSFFLNVAHADTLFGLVKDHSKDYEHTQSGQPLTLPDGLSNQNIHDDYLIPPLDKSQGAPAGADITPPGYDAKAVPANESSIANSPNTQASKPQLNHLFSVARGADNQPILVLHRDLNTAFSLVGKGAQKVGYRVLVSNKEKARYFILDSAGKTNISKTTPMYQLVLQTQPAQQTQVIVTDDQGHAVKADIAETILVNVAKGIAMPDKSFTSKVGAFFSHLFDKVF